MMTWIDWIVVAIPLVIVIGMALKAQTYVKSVADFLAAGRVAGRYVLCVAGAEANMGLVSVVALWEMYYNCGFAVQYWGAVAMPIGLAYGLTGYCTYRFRETRALTMGQFLAIRYNRKSRVFAVFRAKLTRFEPYCRF